MEMQDCVIIGGGIAGLQAAIQLGRYQHSISVIDSKTSGRSNLCNCYHNMLGWPEGVSGQTLRNIGTQQAKDLGVKFIDDTVEDIEKRQGTFRISGRSMGLIESKRVLLATGVKDRLPLPDRIYPCLGISIYVCPDCDGYEIKGKKALVLGSGNVGANMALTLHYWTNELIYINHDKKSVDEELLSKMKEKGIMYYEQEINQLITDDELLNGVILDNGKEIHANHAFIAFGGNKVKSELAEKLGVSLHKNKHILVNPRTQMTSVENVWAAGDVVAHSEQVTIAMGDGMQAAIWIHKTLIS